MPKTCLCGNPRRTGFLHQTNACRSEELVEKDAIARYIAKHGEPGVLAKGRQHWADAAASLEAERSQLVASLKDRDAQLASAEFRTAAIRKQRDTLIAAIDQLLKHL
jgi:hypothetical protein